MTRNRWRNLVLALMLMLAAAAAPLPASAAGQSDLAKVRAVTAQYHDIDAALADDYVRASECVPGMGYHYVKFEYSQSLDAMQPTVLLYEPKANGRMKLVAVEYVIFSDAPAGSYSLFGQTFHGPMTHGIPTHHELHVWLWQGNPDGVFNQTNRKVTC